MKKSAKKAKNNGTLSIKLQEKGYFWGIFVDLGPTKTQDWDLHMVGAVSQFGRGAPRAARRAAVSVAAAIGRPAVAVRVTGLEDEALFEAAYKALKLLKAKGIPSKPFRVKRGRRKVADWVESTG